MRHRTGPVATAATIILKRLISVISPLSLLVGPNDPDVPTPATIR